MKTFLQRLALMAVWLGGIQLSPAPITAGSLQVNLAPAGAVVAGARWNLDGGTWLTNGATTFAATGSHTVSFTNLAQWITPANETVTIFTGQTTVTNGTYLAVALTCTTTASNSVVVSWPAAANGWSPKVNTDLTSTNWVTPSEPIYTNGASKYLIVSPLLGSGFYRLSNP